MTRRALPAFALTIPPRAGPRRYARRRTSTISSCSIL